VFLGRNNFFLTALGRCCVVVNFRAVPERPPDEALRSSYPDVATRPVENEVIEKFIFAFTNKQFKTYAPLVTGSVFTILRKSWRKKWRF
jgi:hypothetical protein